MRLLPLVITVLAVGPPLQAQQSNSPQEVKLVTLATGEHVVRWHGEPGRTYFLQISTLNDPLAKWAWGPYIEFGSGVEISHEVGGTAARGFFRLQYTDQAPPTGVTLENWDIDGDGRSNQGEVEETPQSNPLKFSTSDTGISDGWVVAHGLDPNDPNIAGMPFAGSEVTNLQAYQAGVQAHPNATLTNFDGDDAENNTDADPHDRIINWNPGPHPRFAIIDLEVMDPEELILDDLIEDGTVLLTRVQNHAPVGRVVIDRNQTAHTFLAGNSPPMGEFAGYGPVLVGGKVPGYHYASGGTGTVESLWDPVTGTFTPWFTPAGDHDNLRDERGGLTLATNWLGQSEFIRYSPLGTSLPGDGIPGSQQARIESNGNVVSERGYWRKNSQTAEFDNRVQLPEESAVHSATIVQVQAGNPTIRQWNLIAGTGGLAIAEDGVAFRKAEGDVGKIRVDAVTQQGWVIDKTNNRIRANGVWYPLTSVMGTTAPTEVEILEILDTGLGVARIRKTPASLQTLALLLPYEVIIPQLNAEGNQISDQYESASELKVAKWENAFDESSPGALTLKDDFIGWDCDRFYVRVFGAAALGVDSFKIATEDCPDATYNDDPTIVTFFESGYDVISNSMILVSDDEDDHYFESGAGIDDQFSDRTHRVQLGGNVVLKSIRIRGVDTSVEFKTPVKVKKNMAVDFYRMNVPNVHDFAEIQRAAKITKERYAQVGIRVSVNIIDKEWPLLSPDRGAGKIFPFTGNQTAQGYPVGPMSDEYKSFINLTDRLGLNIYFLEYSYPASGLAITPRQLFYEPDSEEEVDWAFFDKAFINKSVSAVAGDIPAHELGHLLAYKINGDSDHDEPLYNQMSVGGPYSGVFSRKRFDRSQQDRMYQHAAAIDP